MIQYSEVAGNDFVLQNCTSGNVDAIAVVGDDDDGTLSVLQKL